METSYSLVCPDIDKQRKYRPMDDFYLHWHDLDLLQRKDQDQNTFFILLFSIIILYNRNDDYNACPF